MSRENENSANITDVNYDKAFELSGHGRYNRLVLAASCIISNAVALDMFGFSVVVAAASCDLQIGLEEIGLLTAAPFAGLLFALPWGYFADTHGRRKALVMSTSVGFLFAALSSFAANWRLMLILKLIGCSFSTPAFTLTMAYLGECTGRKRRSRFLFIMNSLNVASEIVSYSIALLILPLNFNVPLPLLPIAYKSWRLFTLLLAFPLGLGAIMMLCLYESPKFLANIGHTDAALEVMKKIHAINCGNKNYPVKSLKKIEREEATFWRSITEHTVPLFRPPLLWRTLQLFFLMIVCCSTNNVFFMWYPTMVNIFFNSLSSARSNFGFCEHIQNNSTISTAQVESVSCDNSISLNVIYSGILLGVFLTLLNLAFSKIASHRKLLIISVLLTAGISCILVGLLKQPLASLLFFALIQTPVIGIGIIGSYFVDLYPTSYRGLVTSLAMMVARFSSFAGVIVIGKVIINYCNLTFFIWSVLSFSGIGVCLLLPSDRKNDADIS